MPRSQIDDLVNRAQAGNADGPHVLPQTVLQRSLDEELLFVAADAANEPVAFLAGASMDGALYVVEIDVVRRWQRKGVGRRLMLTAIETARASGLLGVTLTTDRHVPFNAPFYASLGFNILGSDEMPPLLAAQLADEIEKTDGADRRVAMALWF